MSDTPRTDEAIKRLMECGDGGMDLQTFARQLERELAEALKDSERLEWLFEPIIPKTDTGEDAFATFHCAYSSRQAIDNAKKEGER